jgi:hypothetical protein
LMALVPGKTSARHASVESSPKSQSSQSQNLPRAKISPKAKISKQKSPQSHNLLNGYNLLKAQIFLTATISLNVTKKEGGKKRGTIFPKPKSAPKVNNIQNAYTRTIT